MHIAEGILSTPVLAAGAAVTVGGVALGLKRMDDKQVPTVAVLSSAFFAASLIHVPLAGVSVHLILNGLIGVVLGWAAFPALLVALLLQTLVFGIGGLTALGVNVANAAAPAVMCFWLLSGAIRRARPERVFVLGFAAGALATLLAGIMVSLSLCASGKEFRLVAEGVLLAHVALMVVEGFVTGSVVAFLRRVRPEVLGAPVAIAAGDSPDD